MRTNHLFVGLFVVSTLTPKLFAVDKVWNFNSPFGLAVNSQDCVYVAEIKAARISKFNLEGDSQGVIDTIPGYGKLMGPFDIAIGPNDWIYITDCLAHKVIVLDEQEKLQLILGEESKGMSPGQFSEPHFLTVNQHGEIFVADTFNARIQKFSPSGEFISAWGQIGIKPGEFLHHGYLACVGVDNEGFLYVREFDGGRIQKFTEDGVYVATFSSRGTEPGQLDEGYGLSVIANRLICPDTFQSRVQLFDLDGKLLEVWEPGEGNGGRQLNHPVDIAQARTGELVMTDWKNERVVKLSSSGKFLGDWGRSQEGLVDWSPPDWYKRTSNKPIKVGLYGATDNTTLDRASANGIDIIYPSLDNQHRDWGINQQVKHAKALDVEIHPSIACLPFGNGSEPSEIFQEHPEWCLWKRSATEPLSTILSWANAGARSFRADHIAFQVQIHGVQGVMLDYIRYLGTDYGYDPIIIDGFHQKYGLNPLDLPQDDLRWMQYRADFVTAFIVELREKLERQIPDRRVKLSVYLSGDNPAPDEYLKQSLQDWKTWAQMGVIDTVNVAWYTRDFDQIYSAVRRVREAVPDEIEVNSFIACYGGNLNTSDLLRKGFEASIAGGADQVTIYRGDSVDELGLWEAIGGITTDIKSMQVGSSAED